MLRRQITYIYHCVCGGIGLFLSVFLLIIIRKYSRKSMGAYNNLLSMFTVFNIAFSLFHIVGAPAVFGVKHSWVMLSTSPFITNQSVVIWMMLTYCSMYTLSLTMLMFHFVYRYIVICKSKWIYYMRDWKTAVAVQLFCALVLISSVCFYYYTLDQRHEEMVEIMPALINRYGEVKIGLAATYWLETPNGTTIFNLRPWLEIFCVVPYMEFTTVIIVFCGVKTYGILNGVVMSEKTIRTHRELFRALVVQASVPVCLEYVPVFLQFVSTMFGLGMDLEFIPFLIAFNPIFEALAIIYFIKDYRNAVWRIFGKKPVQLESVNLSTHTSTRTEKDCKPTE